MNSGNTPKKLSLEEQAQEIVAEYLKNPKDEEKIKKWLSTEIGAETLGAVWEKWSEEEQDPEKKKQWQDASKNAKNNAQSIRMRKHQAEFKKPAEGALKDLQKAKDEAKAAGLDDKTHSAIEAIEASLKMLM